MKKTSRFQALANLFFIGCILLSPISLFFINYVLTLPLLLAIFVLVEFTVALTIGLTVVGRLFLNFLEEIFND